MIFKWSAAGFWSVLFIIMAATLGAPGCSQEQPFKGTKRLEFRILANTTDDQEARLAAEEDLRKARSDDKLKEEARQRAREGRPPAPVAVKTDKAPGYSWIEVGSSELLSVGLDVDPDSETDGWRDVSPQRVVEAREKGELTITFSGCFLFSRICEDSKLSEEARGRKKFDYFFLTRDPFEGKALTGEYLTQARADREDSGKAAVSFAFNDKGRDLLHELTLANKPSEGPAGFKRRLAIILDSAILSAPMIATPISGGKGMITGNFSKEEVDEIVRTLRGESGAGR